MPKIRRSKIWNHFIKLTPITAKCKFCFKTLKSCGNTTNMKKHLNMHVKREDWAAVIEDSSCEKTETLKTECFPESSNDWESAPTTDPLEESVTVVCQTNSIASSGPVQDNPLLEEILIEEQDDLHDEGSRGTTITNCILYFVCKDSVPFSLIAGEGFKHLMKQVAPFYKIPSQEALKKWFDEKFELASTSYKTHFSNVDHFTVSTDTWTEKVSNRQFLDVTVHYLHRTSIKSVAIETAEITGHDTVDYIETTLSDILSNWNIDSTKVTAIVTTDNGTVAAAVQQSFGFQKHLSCFVLGMNSIATKILCSELLEELLEKVRTVVKWVVDYDKNDDLCKRQISDGVAEKDAKMLILDDKTQWISTFSMLERFSELYRFLNDLLMCEPEAPIISMDDDLTVINQVLSLLRLLKQATREVADQSKVTIAKIIPIVNCMKLKLSKFTHESEIIRKFKNQMEQNLTRRFGFIEHNTLMAAATLLDPRFKNIHFSDPIAVESAKAIIRSQMRTEPEYKQEDKIENFGFDFWNAHNDLAYRSGIRDELSIYLAGPLSSLLSDPLEIWQDIKFACPRLFRQAMKYLAVPTTVLPDSISDEAGNGHQRRILDHRMNKYFFLKSCSKESLSSKGPVLDFTTK